MSTISSPLSSKCVWAYGETVDTPVLGTGLARGESSNLSTPTKIGYVDGYVSDTLDTQVVKGVSVLLGKRQCVSLRNLSRKRWRFESFLAYHLLVFFLTNVALVIKSKKNCILDCIQKLCNIGIGRHVSPKDQRVYQF